MPFAHLDSAMHSQPGHTFKVARVAFCFHLVIEVLDKVRQLFQPMNAVRSQDRHLDVLGAIALNADPNDVHRPTV